MKLIPFSLKGCGYIEDLEWKNSVAQVRIKVIPMAPHEFSTQITLDCRILPQLKEKICKLDRLFPVTSGVRIEFIVDFCRFAAHYPVNDSQGFQDLLMIKGELREITSWQPDSTGMHPLR